MGMIMIKLLYKKVVHEALGITDILPDDWKAFPTGLHLRQQNFTDTSHFILDQTTVTQNPATLAKQFQTVTAGGANPSIGRRKGRR